MRGLESSAFPEGLRRSQVCHTLLTAVGLGEFSANTQAESDLETLTQNVLTVQTQTRQIGKFRHRQVSTVIHSLMC